MFGHLFFASSAADTYDARGPENTKTSQTRTHSGPVSQAVRVSGPPPPPPPPERLPGSAPEPGGDRGGALSDHPPPPHATPPRPHPTSAPCARHLCGRRARAAATRTLPDYRLPPGRRRRSCCLTRPQRKAQPIPAVTDTTYDAHTKQYFGIRETNVVIVYIRVECPGTDVFSQYLNT